MLLTVGWSFFPDIGPKLSQINSLSDIANTNIGVAMNNLSAVFEAIELIRAELPKDKPLIGFAGSPWTVLTYMLEGGSSKNFAHAKKLLYSDEYAFKQLSDFIVEVTSEYLINQIRSGVNLVKLFDSWCGVFNEQEFHKWVIKPTQTIIDNVRKKFSDIPFICFPRKAGLHYKMFCDHVNTDVIAVDETMPLNWITSNTSKVIQGNLDPFVLFASKDRIELEVKKVIESSRGRDLIFNLGHGILPNTPLENVGFLVDYLSNL